MANTYTDIDKWDDDWFLGMPPAYKCVWNFICETSVGCGEKKISFSKISFAVGEEITREKFDHHFQGRVFWTSEDDVFIPGVLARIFRKLNNIPAHVNSAKKILRMTENLPRAPRIVKVRDRFETFLKEILPPEVSAAPVAEPALVQPRPSAGLKDKEGKMIDISFGKEGVGENPFTRPKPRRGKITLDETHARYFAQVHAALLSGGNAVSDAVAGLPADLATQVEQMFGTWRVVPPSQAEKEMLIAFAAYQSLSSKGSGEASRSG